MKKALNWLIGFAAAFLAGGLMWLAIYAIAVIGGPL